MTQRNDLGADPSAEIYRRLEALESMVMLGNTDVSRGNTIFRGLRSLIVKGSEYVEGLLEGIGTFIWQGSMKIIGLGTLDVAGPATFSATLDVTASTRLRGPTTVEDTLDVTAETTLRGPTKIQNTLDVEAETRLRGKTTIEDDTEVTDGGQLKVGQMVMNPTGGETGNGAIEADSAVELTAPTVVASGAIFARGNITAEGNLYAAGAITTPNAPNVYMDASGRLFRTA